jgi:hypothetical protein
MSCVNAEGRPKKAYPSEQAAKHELRTSNRWRLRKSWPKPYQCATCHRFHLGHPDGDK